MTRDKIIKLIVIAIIIGLLIAGLIWFMNINMEYSAHIGDPEYGGIFITSNLYSIPEGETPEEVSSS